MHWCEDEGYSLIGSSARDPESSSTCLTRFSKARTMLLNEFGNRQVCEASTALHYH